MPVNSSHSALFGVGSCNQRPLVTIPLSQGLGSGAASKAAVL